jgi:soluble lytic murein transglycosylase
LLALALLLLLLPAAAKRVYPLPYRDSLLASSSRHGLELSFVASVALVESHFDASAVSNRGAVGIMQLLPTTGVWAADKLGRTITPDDLFNPDLNIEIGTWYLRSLLDEFGDETQALAAYNAGRGNVSRWLSEGTWSGQAEDIARIPFAETRGFVDRVRKAQKAYRLLYRIK